MATLAVPLSSLASAQFQALPELWSSRVGGGTRRLALWRDGATCSLRTEERSGEEEVRRSGLATGASALASLASAGAALADEVAASVPAADGDVGISTTVSVLFVAATIGLVVLTGGVVYLGLSEFLENRAIQEEQKKADAAKSAKKEKSAKQTVKAAARAGGPKGFGSGSRKADDES